MVNEQILFEQPKIIKIGKPFYDDSLPVALEQSQKYAGEEGHVASLPEILESKILASKEDYVWNNWFTCATEEDKGTTKAGKGVYVVVHSKGILMNPDRIRNAYDTGLVNGSARFTKKEFNDLLRGKLPDKSEIPVFSYKDFVKQTELPLAYAVILDFNHVKKMNSGVQEADSLRENKLVIVRSGSEERANKYIDKSKQIYDNRLGNWHDCENIDLSIPQGRLVFAGSNCDGNLNGSNLLGIGGRFVGVHINAEGVAFDSAGSKGVLKPSLEQVLNLALDKGFVAEKLQESFKKELQKLYE